MQREDFDIGLELAKLTKNNHKVGGLTSFVGLVRDIAAPETISSMTLEHYPGMTEKQLEHIESIANQRWHLEASLIIHRYGKSSRCTLIKTLTSGHRREESNLIAFSNCMI